MSSAPPVATKSSGETDFYFINNDFRQEYEAGAAADPNTIDYVSYEADIVRKLNKPETSLFQTYQSIPRGVITKARLDAAFRRQLVQSLILHKHKAMMEHCVKELQKINAAAGNNTSKNYCECACPNCDQPAVKFVGNPGFFLKKNPPFLLDPFCVPVCHQMPCFLQAQHASNQLHAQARAGVPGGEFPDTMAVGGLGDMMMDDDVNPAFASGGSSRQPHSVKACNVCGKFEEASGGTVVKVRTCSRCGVAHYCSKECQIADWNRGHKDVCKPKPAASAPAPAPFPVPMPPR